MQNVTREQFVDLLRNGDYPLLSEMACKYEDELTEEFSGADCFNDLDYILECARGYGSANVCEEFLRISDNQSIKEAFLSNRFKMLTSDAACALKPLVRYGEEYANFCNIVENYSLAYASDFYESTKKVYSEMSGLSFFKGAGYEECFYNLCADAFNNVLEIELERLNDAFNKLAKEVA